jgi:hypothetical protein
VHELLLGVWPPRGEAGRREGDPRLRLELITQNPAEICPPNAVPPRNGSDPCGLTAPQRATVPGGVYSIMRGPQWPSALVLPQLPWKAFPDVAAGTTPTAYSESNRRLEAHGLGLPLDWGK